MGCVFRPLIRFQKRATNLFARNKNKTRCAVYLFSTSQTTITSQDNIGVKIKPLIIITLHFNTTLM